MEEIDKEPNGASLFNNHSKVTELEMVKESEEGISSVYTKDGSSNWHGKPAIKTKTGGWRCAMFILVSQGLTTLAFTGVEVNMVLFSKAVLRQSNAEASNTISTWMGTVYLFSLFGAFISDSYFTRFFTCVSFYLLLILGLVGLSFSTQTFLLKPQGCGRTGQLCDSHSPSETAIFYISIYLIAIGQGSPEPALAALGADQFDEEDSNEKVSKTSFYRYFYVALNLGSLVAETILVYIENLGYWVFGYWVCAASALAAYALLLSGTFRYRHFNPNGNPLSRFCQVIVASLRKIKVKVPENANALYEVHGRGGENNGMRKILHSNDFKFLDRAAVITQAETNLETSSPWRLCTITQVEEVKCVLRLLPIWFCTILSSSVFIQMLSLFIEQGAAMDTTISKFNFPPASMYTFDIISTSAFILLYDKLIVRLYVKVTKKEPKPPSELQRIGIGIVILAIAMMIAGLVEQQRLGFGRKLATQEMSSLSIFWQTPQYVLVGVAEAFVYVAQMEFFGSQIPDGLKSLGIGLSMASYAAGSYINSMMLSLVMVVTARDGKPGWVAPNLNDGHLDRYFFISAGLTLVDLGIFVVFARRYKSASFEKRDGTSH